MLSTRVKDRIARNKLKRSYAYRKYQQATRRFFERMGFRRYNPIKSFTGIQPECVVQPLTPHISALPILGVIKVNHPLLQKEDDAQSPS